MLTAGWKLGVVLLMTGSFLLAVPGVVNAQLLPSCDPVPGRHQGGRETCGVGHVFQLLLNIYNLLLGLSVLVAMSVIVLGGLRMFYWSFMEDSAAELEQAKFTVRRAIGGFVIIILAYLIVNTLIVWLGGGSIAEILPATLF